MSLSLPVSPGLPLVGRTFDLVRDGALDLFDEIWREQGDAFLVPAAGRVMAVLVHPDMVDQVLTKKRKVFIKGAAYDEFRKLGGTGLVSSEGERWKRDRRLAQPAFHRKQIAALTDMMVDSTERAVDRWARRRAELDVGFEMMRLAMTIMGHALFAQDLSDAASSTASAMTRILEAVVKRANEPLTLPLSVPTPANREFRRMLEVLDDSVRTVIDNARRGPAAADDSRAVLLRMLVGACDDETGEAFSEDELRDQIITLFIAGHETTALTLTWSIHLLHRHRWAMDKIQAEVDAVLGRRRPTFADLAKLVYTQQILNETMRLRPPLWAVARNAVHAEEVCGFEIPAGAWVLLPLFLTHRHPAFWPDPGRFDPDRFAPGVERHKAAFVPFSSGARRCIGDRFALTEMTLVLAMLAQRGRLERSDDEPLAWEAKLSLRPARPVYARFVPRDAA